MSHADTLCRQKIVGLLKKAGGTLSYEQLEEGTEGFPSSVFDPALGDMIEKGEIREKDGQHMLLNLIVEQTAPSAAARITHEREIAQGIPQHKRQTKAPRVKRGWNSGQFPSQHELATGQEINPGRFSPISRKRGGEEVRAKIVELLTQAKGALPKPEILEGIDNAVTRRGLDYLVNGMVNGGVLARLGPKSNPKFTTIARQAECEQHIAELQARDLNIAQHRQPGPRLVPVSESPFAQAAIAAANLPGEMPMANKNAELESTVLAVLRQKGAFVPAAAVVAEIRGGKAPKVKACLRSLAKAGTISTAGAGRGLKYGVKGAKESADAAPKAANGKGHATVGHQLQEAADRAQEAFEAFITSCLNKDQVKQLNALRQNRDNARQIAAEWQGH